MKYQRYKSESTIHSRVISENGGNCKRGGGSVSPRQLTHHNVLTTSMSEGMVIAGNK